MPRGHITEDQEYNFIRDWNAGAKVYIMAENYGVSEPTIYTHAKRLGLKPRTRQTVKEISRELDFEFIRDWQFGKPLKDMAIKYRVHQETVKDHAELLGLTPRKRGRH